MASSLNYRENPAYAWLFQIQPNRSPMARKIYLASKRMMDLLILLMAMPFLLPF